MPGRAIAQGGSAGAIGIAAGGAVAAALALIGLGAGLTGFVALALVPIVVWIARQDLADFTIPDGAVLALAAGKRPLMSSATGMAVAHAGRPAPSGRPRSGCRGPASSARTALKANGRARGCALTSAGRLPPML